MGNTSSMGEYITVIQYTIMVVINCFKYHHYPSATCHTGLLLICLLIYVSLYILPLAASDDWLLLCYWCWPESVDYFIYLPRTMDLWSESHQNTKTTLENCIDDVLLFVSMVMASQFYRMRAICLSQNYMYTLFIIPYGETTISKSSFSESSAHEVQL